MRCERERRRQGDGRGTLSTTWDGLRNNSPGCATRACQERNEKPSSPSTASRMARRLADMGVSGVGACFSKVFTVFQVFAHPPRRAIVSKRPLDQSSTRICTLPNCAFPLWFLQAQPCAGTVIRSHKERTWKGFPGLPRHIQYVVCWILMANMFGKVRFGGV